MNKIDIWIIFGIVDHVYTISHQYMTVHIIRCYIKILIYNLIKNSVKKIKYYNNKYYINRVYVNMLVLK